MSDWLHNIDWAVALRSETLTPLFKGFSALGYGGFLILFLPLGYWAFNKKTFARVGLWLMISVLLNAWLKDFFQDPRPDASLALDGHVGKSFGFPSGHAQMAVVVWLGIAWQTRKIWIWVVCAFLVTSICFSRLYLGVHDVADVLGGIAIGGLSLWVFALLTTKRFSSLQQIHYLWQVAALAVMELLFFITWPGGLSLRYIGYGLFLLSFWLGIGLERTHLDFQKHAQVWRVLASAVLGVMGLLLIKKGFGYLVGVLNAYRSPLLLTQAIFNGLFMALLAPWLFVQTNLAASQTSHQEGDA